MKKRLVIVLSVLLALSLALGLPALAGPAVTVFRAIRVTVQAIFAGPVAIDNTLAVTGRTTTAGLTSSAVITGTSLALSAGMSATTGAFSGAVSTGALTPASVASTAGVTAGSFLVLTPRTAITVTTAAFTPTGSYQPIASASWVTPTINILGAGTVLRLVNTGTNNITIADTSIQMLSANIVLGQYDSLALMSDGTNWIQVATSDN